MSLTTMTLTITRLTTMTPMTMTSITTTTTTIPPTTTPTTIPTPEPQNPTRKLPVTKNPTSQSRMSSNPLTTLRSSKSQTQDKDVQAYTGPSSSTSCTLPSHTVRSTPWFELNTLLTSIQPREWWNSARTVAASMQMVDTGYNRDSIACSHHVVKWKTTALRNEISFTRKLLSDDWVWAFDACSLHKLLYYRSSCQNHSLCK